MAASFAARLIRMLLAGWSIAGIAIALFLAWPRTYAVPSFQVRAATKYWELPTGSRIGYTQVTSPQQTSKPPVIYLHGGPGGMVTDAAISALAPLSEAGYDLYLYDQLGSGHSSRLRDITAYTVSRHVADLAAIVEKIGAQQVILIGHSWGSLLAMQYLNHYPDRVTKMALVGPGPILPIHSSLAKSTPPDSLNLRAPAFTNREGNAKAMNWRMKFVRKYAYTFGRKLASDREVDDFFTYLNNELNKSTHCQLEQAEKFPGGGGYYAHIMTVKSFATVADEKATISQLDTPVLILRGQCDNQAWGYTQEYLERLNNVKLIIIPDRGHDLVSGDSSAYLQELRTFLR